MDPATLGSGGGEHIAQRRPQPKGAVANRQHRCLHAAPAQIAQQLRPRLGRLTQPVGDRDQLLGPVGPHPDDDQGAQPLLGQADVEVHPVGPHIDVVPIGQAAGHKRLPVGLPLAGQPGDH